MEIDVAEKTASINRDFDKVFRFWSDLDPSANEQLLKYDTSIETPPSEESKSLDSTPATSVDGSPPSLGKLERVFKFLGVSPLDNNHNLHHDQQEEEHHAYPHELPSLEPLEPARDQVTTTPKHQLLPAAPIASSFTVPQPYYTPNADAKYFSDHYVNKLARISDKVDFAVFRPPAGGEDEETVSPVEVYHTLFDKVFNAFRKDRRYLVTADYVTGNAGKTTTKDGLHIFIDASNIMVGFYDFMKKKNNLDRWHGHISAKALTLILERGRPTSRRILAGSKPTNSKPLDPVFAQLGSVGYELSLLDRVFKVKELTSRQKFFALQQQQSSPSKYRQHRDRSKYLSASGGGGTTDSASDSATTLQRVPPKKWVEQGVDEILHLKMAESIMDAAKPSTMVLATGDAAEAEFSEGFMKMVLRALNLGWTVEIVGWRDTISSAYRRQDFLDVWRGKVRVVELDEFADELVGI